VVAGWGAAFGFIHSEGAQLNCQFSGGESIAAGSVGWDTSFPPRTGPFPGGINPQVASTYNYSGGIAQTFIQTGVGGAIGAFASDSSPKVQEAFDTYNEGVTDTQDLKLDHPFEANGGHLRAWGSGVLDLLRWYEGGGSNYNGADRIGNYICSGRSLPAIDARIFPAAWVGSYKRERRLAALPCTTDGNFQPDFSVTVINPHDHQISGGIKQATLHSIRWIMAKVGRGIRLAGGAETTAAELRLSQYRNRSRFHSNGNPGFTTG
jgi:hypothetical protein